MMMKQNLSCTCTACVARAIEAMVSDDERRSRLPDALRSAGRREDEIDELEWWISREGTPINLSELPKPDEQLFWDVLGILMTDPYKYSYHTLDGPAITLGGGKLVAGVNGRQREYACANALRSDYESGDRVAVEAVQLAEQMITYMYADREQYNCLRVNGLPLSVEVDYDGEVVHVDRGGTEFYRYTLDEFVSLIGSDRLVSEGADLLDSSGLDWRP